MSAASVQNVHGSSHGAASVVLHPTANTTAGNLLTAAICLPSSCSVASITDNIGSRWIQLGYSYNTNGGAELWMARGVPAGSASVTVSFTSAASVGVNLAEWAGISYLQPADQWSQNAATGASVTTQAVQPRQNGDLFIAVVAGSSALTNGPTGGYHPLTVDGTGNAAAYLVQSGSISSSTTWAQTSSGAFAAVHVCFLAGQTGLNPNMQIPEVEVQISTQGNYQAPLLGTGIWTSISNTVRSMTIGPLGKQHELDRVQACQMQLTCDNRATGTFNPWNTSSFLYSGGLGLKPMNPVKITAAWTDGVTHPIGYGYLQSVTTTINDVLDIDATLQCIDIFQALSLKYLSEDLYAELVEADGGSKLVTYYRMGDNIPGQFFTTDASGNNATGSLLSGPAGTPAYGATGAFLYDAHCSLDCTNGSNGPNGGVQMIDTTTQPPTVHNPLQNSSGSWTFECWASWTQSAAAAPTGDTGNTPNGVLFHAASAVPVGHSAQPMELQIGWANNLPGSVGSINRNFMQIYDSAPGLGYGEIPFEVFDGFFHHYVFVSGSVSAFYVDGQLLTNGTTPAQTASVSGITFATTPINVAPLTLQSNYPVLAESWPGSIQEVALYSRALTAAEIANHYSTGVWFRTPEFGASVGTQAASVARLNKVIAVAGLPQSMIYCPYPFRTELYGETNSVSTTSALNYVQTMTETEAGGIIFQGPDGALRAYSRQYFYLSPSASVSQVTFGDNTNTSYHYQGPATQIVQDDLDVFNDVQAQSGRISLQSLGSLPGHSQGVLQEWGQDQSTALAQSASVYGTRTLQGLTSLQFLNDSDALATAQWYAAIYGTPQQRVQQITIDSMSNGGANIPQMLGRGLFDRITAQYAGQTAGNQFSQAALIEQITHTVDLSQPSWVTAFSLSPYEITLSPTILGSWKFGTAASVAVLTL